MIVLESIGFAGTHTICNILSELPGYEVSHGSQVFGSGGELISSGAFQLTMHHFASAMAASDKAGRRPVAVHCLFNPMEFREVCDRHGIRFGVLVREPVAQIESCYSWCAKKVLAGDATSLSYALQIGLAVLEGAGIRGSLPNLIYAFACMHVGNYNALGIDSGAPLLQMEALLNDEAAFRAAFDVPEEAELPHFSGARRRMASHRAAPELQALAAPEREAIRAAVRFGQAGSGLRFDQLAATLGY